MPRAPEMPAAAVYLWKWFLDLSGHRGFAGFGPARITMQDILAHSLLTQRWPEPWELQAITELDLAWLAHRGAGDLDDGAPA